MASSSLDRRGHKVSRQVPELFSSVFSRNVGAGVATAAVETAALIKTLAGTWRRFHLVQDAPGLVSTNETGGRAGGRAGQQLACGADEVGEIEQVGLWQFRMGDHFGCGCSQLQPQHGLLAEGFVHDAAAGPEGEFTPTSVGPPATQVLGRAKGIAARWQLLH